MLSVWHLLYLAAAIFWASHEIWLLGSLNQNTGRRREGDERGSAKLLIVLLSITLLGPIILLDSVRKVWLAPMDLIRQFGVLAMFGGNLLRHVAARTLGGAWSRDLGRFAGEPLRVHGIYAWVRHPSYTGFIVASIGAALAWPHPLVALPAILIPITAFALRIRVEEAILERLYGREYVDYKARTWSLVPFLV